MTLEQQRIKIAEACGWTGGWSGINKAEMWVHPNPELQLRIMDELPDYLNDLNAMHEAEMLIAEFKLTNPARSQIVDWGDYITELARVTENSCVSATAAQRSEAFLRALGLWETP